MGHVFQHLDDLEVAKTLLGDQFKVIKLGEENLVGNQAGRSIMIDETWELTPVYSIKNGQNVKPVVWDVWRYVQTHGTYMEPPDVDETELVTNVSFDKAIKAIKIDIMDSELDAAYEMLYFDDMHKQEELEGEA